MRKILLFTFAAFLLSFSAFSQSSFTLSPEAEARCTELTRKMALEMRLNEIGYIKLKALNRERIATTENLLKNHTGDEQQLNLRLQELEIAYDEHVKSFLNANQLQAYANYKQQGSTNFRFVAVSQD